MRYFNDTLVYLPFCSLNITITAQKSKCFLLGDSYHCRYEQRERLDSTQLIKKSYGFAAKDQDNGLVVGKHVESDRCTLIVTTFCTGAGLSTSVLEITFVA